MVCRRDILCGELPDVRVGIGAGTDRDAVVRSASAFGENAEVYDDSGRLAADLADGTIDAAVRGSMSSSVLLPKLKEALGLDCIERVVLLEPQGGRMFCLAPVGIDEGCPADARTTAAGTASWTTLWIRRSGWWGCSPTRASTPTMRRSSSRTRSGMRIS